MTQSIPAAASPTAPVPALTGLLGSRGLIVGLHMTAFAIYCAMWPLILGYRYDRFTLDNYALNPATIDRLVFGSTLLMGITDRPYTANTVFVKLVYLW